MRDDVAVDELAHRRDDLRLLVGERHAGTASVSAERCKRRGQVVLLVECEDRLLEPLDIGVGQRERGVLAELLAHLVGRQRVLRAALLVRVVRVERRPVGEPHLDPAGERLRVGRVVARLVAHLCRHREHRRVGDRLVGEVADGYVTADEKRCDRVLEREFPLVLGAWRPLLPGRLQHERDARLGNRHEDVLDLVRRERASCRSFRGGAEAAVHEMADRKRLVGDPRRLPALAEVGELPRDVDLAFLRAEERVVEPEFPLEDGAGALGAVRREPRRQVGAVSCPRRVHRLRRRALGEIREETARERARDPERARRAARDRAVRDGSRPRRRRRSRRSRSGGSRARGRRPGRPSRRGRRPRSRRRSRQARRGRSRRAPRRPRVPPARPPSTRGSPSRSACRRSRARGRASRSRRQRWPPAGAPPSPITVACGSPPCPTIVARPSCATPVACAASPQPIVSRTCSFASSRTASGTSSSSSVVAHSAIVRAADIRRSTPRRSAGSGRPPRAPRAGRP